jgi:spore germination protein YaaH
MIIYISIMNHDNSNNIQYNSNYGKYSFIYLFQKTFMPLKVWFHDGEIFREKLCLRNADGCT